jgi:large subunit ribosomal protein L25
MMDSPTLALSKREVIGKKVKTLRREGVTPVHMYGSKIVSSSLQAEQKSLGRILLQVGRNVPLNVKVEGLDDENICFVREVQRHPVTEEILHVDFLRVEATQTVSVDIPVILEGMAPAVRNLGGTLLQPMQVISVESLPMNMPASIIIDVSELDDFEKAIRVKDVHIAADVTVLSDESEMVARVVPPRIEEEDVVVGEDEEVLEEGGMSEDEEVNTETEPE